MTLYLFDDAVAQAWQPFTLTRPAGELMLGAMTFRARAERLFGARCAGHIAADHLRGFDEPFAAPVIGVPGRADNPRLFLSSRAVLDWSTRVDWPADAADIVLGDEVVGRFVPAGAAPPPPEWFRTPAAAGGRTLPVEGRTLQRPWDLIAENPRQITLDVAFAQQGSAAEPASLGVDSRGYAPGAFRMGDDVVIEPHVLFDFSHGPIWLDDGVTVRAFTRLVGPAYVGRGSTLLGGPYEALSVGPVCRVHGEVEESVILGYSNKAHDGFLGHAYLGRWVNLGALTTNSDLKNNYGTIRLWTPDGDTDTGLMKLGSLLGDHVKTGIGTLLNTGTVIGAGSNLYGTDMPPKYVPPFSWGSGSALVAYEIDRFIKVAETVMQRREVTLTDGMKQVLRAAWQLGRHQS